MRILCPVLFGMSVVVLGGSLAGAQDAMPSPPKVIQITREWIKPGKMGMVHDRSEAAFVSLNNRAKLQGHYVALNSMSGKSRALYITRFPSLQAWEADNKVLATGAFATDFDRAASGDGELLDGMDQAVGFYNPDLSFHPHGDISHARYYEITSFRVRPGHRKDFADLTKMYKEALDKAGSSAHWAAYEVNYGADCCTYLSITARNSLSEIDDENAAFNKVMEAAGGEDGMAKIDQAFGQAIESSHSELFSINPKQSYPEDSWAKADPDFWKPRMKAASEASAPKPAAPKPAAQPAAASKPGTR
ncbi:hypothetical protein [Occallatibacter riparius]|uniref:Uncharacterized protein n=1 Tax=Occallatibacter riparius TaxID=1002689 RepID=A0A9J7BNG9_9BACT|nr:hypothetical protein [Occallatibacter riparius]UWZ84267.1 hypothetical protein MOP44_27440 [Occallatibacter riparius]